MKFILSIIAILIATASSAQLEKFLPPKPTPPRLVNDHANLLTPEQEAALEAKLVAYDDSTSSQIVIVAIPTLRDSARGLEYEDEEAALHILMSWGVGQAKIDNGIVILVVKNERKVRIEVGYGLEGAIPDALAGDIIQYDIRPNFRQENYYRGLDEATTSLFEAAAGEYVAPEGYNKRKEDGDGGGISIGKIILIIIVIIIVMSAGGGRGGRGYMSRRGYRRFGTPWILPGALGSGWGSGSGGGGFGGFSGGGGGFGGFGGGMGGGGGASGSW